MLVLSRKKNGVIRIGDDIKIIVIEVREDSVRLRIKAPRHLRVDHLEVSRKRSEVIRLGNGIEVMVVDIRGHKVRLGISAPRHIPVDREEVWVSKNESKALAGAGQPDS